MSFGNPLNRSSKTYYGVFSHAAYSSHGYRLSVHLGRRFKTLIKFQSVHEAIPRSKGIFFVPFSSRSWGLVVWGDEKLDMEKHMVLFGLVCLQILEKPKNGTLFDVDWFCRNLAHVDTMNDFLSCYLMPASLYLQAECQNFFTNQKIPLCPDVSAEIGKISQ